INLSDVLSIAPTQSTAGSAAGDVGFAYPTEASYRADQNDAKNKHLVVTSTKGFNVTVKAAGIAGATATAFQGPASAEIPFGVMVVKVLGTSTLVGTPITADVILSDTAQPLITGAAIGSVQEINIDYSIPAAKASSTDILGKPAGDY